jgi:DNA invertase Pin-like site-specific DNA recombinase
MRMPERTPISLTAAVAADNWPASIALAQISCAFSIRLWRRDGRPEFDRMCRDAAKRQFDVVMAWSVDRLGRSLQDLVAFLSELHSLRIDLYLHQQGIDTATPAGKAMFQMMGVFAEFERSMIQERVRAGLKRAVEEGKQLGRPPIAPEVEQRIREALRARASMRKIAARFGISTNTVLKVSRGPFDASAAAA